MILTSISDPTNVLNAAFAREFMLYTLVLSQNAPSSISPFRCLIEWDNGKESGNSLLSF